MILKTNYLKAKRYSLLLVPLGKLVPKYTSLKSFTQSILFVLCNVVSHLHKSGSQPNNQFYLPNQMKVIMKEHTRSLITDF